MKPSIILALLTNLFCLTIFGCGSCQKKQLSDVKAGDDTLIKSNNCNQIRTKANIFYNKENKKNLVQNWVYDYVMPDSIVTEISFINDDAIFGNGDIENFKVDIYIQFTYSKTDDCMNMLNPIKGEKSPLVMGLSIDKKMFFKDYNNQNIAIEDNYTDFVYKASFPIRFYTDKEITSLDKSLYLSQISILTSVYINSNDRCEHVYTLPICIN